MASGSKPRYERIGFTVFAAVAAIAATLVYIGGFGSRQGEFLVEMYYDNPVSGLAPGSDVNFRGVKIGEVRDIVLEGLHAPESFVMSDSQRIRILLAINLRKLGVRHIADKEVTARKLDDMIARGLRGTVVSSGITGLSHIEFNILDNPPPAASVAWKSRHPLIPPAPSLMESLSDTATRVINQINKIDLVSVWTNLQIMAESAAKLAGNADGLLESQRANIDAILRDAAEAVSRLDEFSRRISENPSLLIRNGNPEKLPETR